MTISKLPPVLCALAVGALCFTVRAEDNPAQAAARNALAKQLFESQGTNAPATSPAAPPEDSKEAKAKARAEAKAKAKAEKEAKAREEAEAKQAAAAKAQSEKAAADAQARQQAAQAAAPKTEQTPVVVAQPAPEQAPVTGDNSAQAAARAALARQLFETTPPAAANNWATAPATEPKPAGQVATTTSKPVPAPRPVVAPPVVVSKPGDNNYVGKDLGLKPIAAPALPITATKAQRLQALLEQYKADKITPEEYHQQRAAILAEP